MEQPQTFNAKLPNGHENKRIINKRSKIIKQTKVQNRDRNFADNEGTDKSIDAPSNNFPNSSCKSRTNSNQRTNRAKNVKMNQGVKTIDK